MAVLLYPYTIFKMDDKNPSPMPMADFSSSLLVEIKSLSNTLKPVSKTLYEVPISEILE